MVVALVMLPCKLSAAPDAAVLLTDQGMAAVSCRRLSLHTALLQSSDCLMQYSVLSP